MRGKKNYCLLSQPSVIPEMGRERQKMEPELSGTVDCRKARGGWVGSCIRVNPATVSSRLKALLKLL